MKTTTTKQLQTETAQPKANKQAGTQQILQKYKQQTAQLQVAEEEELLQGKFDTAQRMGLDEEEHLQGKFDTTQRMELDEEEPLQGKFATTQLAAEEQALAAKPNNTGLPDNLKSGIENLSGYSMDDVKVHYNSDKPAQLQAHAYAQGTDIHIAPGQEKHLPHEAWHVVQQKQGRVKPTIQMKGAVPVNDDVGLEKEADVMGEKALQMKTAYIGGNSVAQRIESNDTREVNIDELTDEQAEKHMINSFQKGKMYPPVLNKFNEIVQRVSKSYVDGGELFTVSRADLGTGTGTSKSTRAYVNDPSTPKPASVLFDYITAGSPKKASTSVIKNNLAHEVDNPVGDKSYKSGSYWDAGHKLGSQNGGHGHINDGVFPQNPAYNQGNHRNMNDDSEETHPLWRSHEDAFHNGVKSDGWGAWWVKFT